MRRAPVLGLVLAAGVLIGTIVWATAGVHRIINRCSCIGDPCCSDVDLRMVPRLEILAAGAALAACFVLIGAWLGRSRSPSDLDADVPDAG